jgi:signal transduction histidine kinase
MRADSFHTDGLNRMDFGEPIMSDSFEGGGRRSRRHRRHRRAKHGEAPADERADADLTPEERSLRIAHANAERKTRIAGDVLWFLGVTLMLAIFIPPVAAVVFVVWGIKLGKQVYELELEPRLRERFVEQEIENQVAASLSGQRRVLEGEHARSLEQLSAAIAHEIRNPITAAKSLVQQLGETPTAPENVEYARVALEELQRVERSVSHLLRFAREEEQGLTTVSMADIIESAMESFRDRAARAGITLDHRIDCEGALRADAEQLRRVVINLIGNAIDSFAETDVRDPRVDVHMGENLAGTEVWLQVKDNGEGIDPENIRKVFSPFYTSKEHGTGLGLAITKKLVEAHGGSIEVTSEPGAGTTFVLTFPKRLPQEGETP